MKTTPIFLWLCLAILFIMLTVNLVLLLDIVMRMASVEAVIFNANNIIR